VDDYAVATSGTGVARVFREKKLAPKTARRRWALRLAGADRNLRRHPGQFLGELTGGACPKARWQDISEEFSHLMLSRATRNWRRALRPPAPAKPRARSSPEVAAPGVGEEVVLPKARAKCAPRHGVR